jgi:hypothetical protein
MPAARTRRDFSGIVGLQSRRSLASLRRRGKFTSSTLGVRKLASFAMMKQSSKS